MDSWQRLPQVSALLRNMGVPTAQLQSGAISHLRTRYPLFNHGKLDGFYGFVQCLGPAKPSAQWSLFSLLTAVMKLENKPKRFPWLLWICF